MHDPIFTGVCTALVTPFLEGSVNYPMLEQLIYRQAEAHVSACVLSGTTGESPTLSDKEKLTMFRRAKEAAPEDMVIIAGTGSNSTAHAISLSQAAEDAGVDALLVVSPYYNKATPEGLYAHYAAIAGSVHIPVIAYNVPGRTGMDIPVEVYRRLADIPQYSGSQGGLHRYSENCQDPLSLPCPVCRLVRKRRSGRARYGHRRQRARLRGIQCGAGNDKCHGWRGSGRGL